MTSSPAPQVRQAVRDLPAYVPGRPPAPRPGVTTYKLSSNENPNDPLPGVLEAAVEAAGRMNRYPDMGCTALYAALADRLDVPATHLAAGTGSVAVLYHLLQAFCEPGDEVVYAWRSFEAYPIAVAVPRRGLRAGAADRGRPARPRRDGRRGHRPHQGGHRLQPEQPDRPGRPPRRARGVPRPGARRTSLVVLDEAYREFVRDRGPLRRRGRLPLARPNVVAMRTFAKAYGLAGFRVGYARRARADRRRRPRLRAAVRRLVGRAGRGGRVAGRARPSCSSGSTAIVAERTRVVDRAARAGLGRARTRRATSSGCRSATGPPTSPPPPRRPG